MYVYYYTQAELIRKMVTEKVHHVFVLREAGDQHCIDLISVRAIFLYLDFPFPLLSRSLDLSIHMYTRIFY